MCHYNYMFIFQNMSLYETDRCVLFSPHVVVGMRGTTNDTLFH